MFSELNRTRKVIWKYKEMVKIICIPVFVWATRTASIRPSFFFLMADDKLVQVVESSSNMILLNKFTHVRNRPICFALGRNGPGRFFWSIFGRFLYFCWLIYFLNWLINSPQVRSWILLVGASYFGPINLASIALLIFLLKIAPALHSPLASRVRHLLIGIL